MSAQSAEIDGSRLPRDMAGFRDLHAGATALVCGCGPSLEALRGGVDCLTIGVNDVGRVLSPTYLVVVNPRTQFAADRLKLIEETPTRAVFSQLTDLRPQRAALIRFRLGNYNGVDPSRVADTLHYTQNSPYVAVCLALHLGARRIGLIGVDFAEPHVLARHLAQIDREYGKLLAAARARGIEIVNLSDCSRLQSLPHRSLAEFLGPPAAPVPRAGSLNIVSYATTPVAGVPAVLARCIAERTSHRARCIWASDDYGNGIRFDDGEKWGRDPAGLIGALRDADLIIIHNGKVHERHRATLASKPTITMAHNYAWNVDRSWVERGDPGVVVGQYQATLPEFRGWSLVPNPVPWWQTPFTPSGKDGPVRICFTPSAPHEQYPAGHRMFWHAKGFAATLRVLDSLSKRYPLVVETTRDGQVSHAESLAMKRRAHIVIDECVTGSYHRNSLEGLAAGCVVVNGVGRVPEIAQALLDCTSPRAADSPFVVADLETLESVLAQLISLGPEELVERGARGRRWLETHWGFGEQWETHWATVVARAMQGRPVRRAEQLEPRGPALAAPAPEGLCVVIPHGGAERLSLLATTVAFLKENAGIAQIIIAEEGERPLAGAIATRWQVEHVFIESRRAFNKSRVLNVGSALARHDIVLWWDNDLVFPAASLRRAVAEMREQRADVFFPYFQIGYLDEHDSAAVARGERDPADCRLTAALEAIRGAPGGILMVRADFIAESGGMCEEFSGWGGEDCAWLHKARLLGKVAVTSMRSHIAWHLWHRGSGISGGDPRQRNAAYQQNAQLWAEIAGLQSRAALLERLPPPTHRPLPWSAATHVQFSIGADASAALREAAETWGGELLERYGLDVFSRNPTAGARRARVVFGSAEDEDSEPVFRVPESMASERSASRLIEALSTVVCGAPQALSPIETAGLNVWMYWEGPCPDWIAACQATVRRHAPNVRLLNRADFEALRDSDRDIDISRLQIPHRADFVRAYILHRYGGLWLDSDCIVMQPLAPVLEHLRTFDFVGHRERGGLVSNAFMAARSGSAVAKAFYETVRTRLRSRDPLSWISLGNEPLTRVVEGATVPWLELDVEKVQPICWSRPEAFFARGTTDRHARELRDDAFCYMLSNQNVMRHQSSHPELSLMAPDTLFSYLLERSQGVTQPGGGSGRARQHAAFFASAISRLRPQSVLELGPRSAAWSELARECAEEGAPPVCTNDASRVPSGEAHYDLIISGNDADWSLNEVLARADYTLFTASSRREDLLLSPALIEHVLCSNDVTGRYLAGLLSAHDPAGLRAANDQVEIFRQMHAGHAALGIASTSGPGSTLEQTVELRQRLPLLLQYLRVESIHDVACGDYFWQRHTRFGVRRYIGTDVLDALARSNREQFGSDAVAFLARDARTDALPACDAILCRDYLVHLSYRDIARVLSNFVASGSRYLIATTFPKRPAHPDINNGEWRPLNLCAPPLCLPAPLHLINEKCTEGGGAFADKSLGVWRLADIASRTNSIWSR